MALVATGDSLLDDAAADLLVALSQLGDGSPRLGSARASTSLHPVRRSRRRHDESPTGQQESLNHLPQVKDAAATALPPAREKPSRLQSSASEPILHHSHHNNHHGQRDRLPPVAPDSKSLEMIENCQSLNPSSPGHLRSTSAIGRTAGGEMQDCAAPHRARPRKLHRLSSARKDVVPLQTVPEPHPWPTQGLAEGSRAWSTPPREMRGVATQTDRCDTSVSVHNMPLQEREIIPDFSMSDSRALREKDEELQRMELQIENLRNELRAVTTERNHFEVAQENDSLAARGFVNSLMQSSSSDTLGARLKLDEAEVLGSGNYGYVLKCRRSDTNDEVVVKLLSARWASVAIKEWSHGSVLGRDPHIVEYQDMLIHRDSGQIADALREAFQAGRLTGKQPRVYPSEFLCMILEYMDRGTVEDFMNKGYFSLEGIAAVARQVAEALTFIHRRKATHNDIKPENILLREGPPGSSCLIVKLADLGLAEYSTDRARDMDLYAYTMWCVGTASQFSRVPPKLDIGQLEVRLKNFDDAAPVLCSALLNVVEGVKSKEMTMQTVAEMKAFDACEVRPLQEERSAELEQCAKRNFGRRHSILPSVSGSLAQDTLDQL